MVELPTGTGGSTLDVDPLAVVMIFYESLQAKIDSLGWLHRKVKQVAFYRCVRENQTDLKFALICQFGILRRVKEVGSVLEWWVQMTSERGEWSWICLKGKYRT